MKSLNEIRDERAEEYPVRERSPFKCGFDSAIAHMQKEIETIKNQELILKKLEEIRDRVTRYLY